MKWLVALLLIASTAYADELAGTWRGTWTKAGDALAVDVTFTGSGTGSFDAHAIEAAGIPFSAIRDDGGKIHLEVNGDDSTTVFDGVLAGGAMHGTFTDGTWELHRAPLPSATVTARDVRFRDGDVELAGTVLAPKRAGTHPAIAFMHGSGPEGRWANHWLAQQFAEAGFVALIYDKRGVGGSTGDWQHAGFDALAADAAAGVRLLQSLPEVDRARVGIYGHSQGGTLAPLAAITAGDLRFVIASAAGGIAPADVELYSVGNAIGIAQLPVAEQADARAFVQAIVDVAYRGAPRATLDALAARDDARRWYFTPPPPSDSYWALSKRFAAFDPARAWQQVHAAVLLVYGAHDERVPPDDGARAIEAALHAGGNERVTSLLFPASDHSFAIGHGAWPKREPSYAPTLIAWARGVVN